mmetsp:Transcript_39113/g.118142  ORF Transcript_39113/g.118142 Transcript_39113/m.118142 type:complete len:277 (-) Transcript_39113:137-967(-)
MKEDLMARAQHGNGLVPLAKFWSHEDRKSAMFSYVETKEHLRAIGALDETSGRHPQVRVANYMLGPLNCGWFSSTMSRCCLNECEVLMREVEDHVRAPMVEPDVLISVASNLSTSSADAPRHLPSALLKRLHAIAAKRGGQVPLHGRLFAEWLHLAFPNECPFPHVVTDGAVHTSSHWYSNGNGEEHILTAEAQADEIRLISAQGDELHVGPDHWGSRPWVEDEVLHMPVSHGWGGSWLAGSARVSLFFGMGVFLLRLARASAREDAGCSRGEKFS